MYRVLWVNMYYYYMTVAVAVSGDHVKFSAQKEQR